MTKKLNKTKIASNFIKFFKDYTKENSEQFKNIKIRDCQKYAMAKLDEIINAEGHSMLLNMTCGTGKTMVECFTINYFASMLEQENKHGIFCFGSHRLLLNEQLIDELKRFIPDLDKRFEILIASSASKHDNKFDKIYINTNLKKDLNYKHVIVVSCAKTMNNNSDKNDMNDENLYTLMHANKLTFECAVMDEAHKDLSEKTINNIKSISNFVMACTATAGKKFKTWFDGIYSYNFKQALKANVVVKPILYCAVNRYSEKKQHQASMVEYSFNHLKKEGKAQLCCFFNTVDNLMSLSETMRKKFTNVNVCVLASNKEIPVLDENGIKTGKKIKIHCEWNGVEKEKEDVLNLLKEHKDEDCIILSAFMIQEGIDISTINGVGIFCRKSDASLYQAICRGDRFEIGKNHFNVYVSADLLEEDNKFLQDLIFGFDNEMEFGGSIDDKGKGKNEKDDDLKNLIAITPNTIKTIKTQFEEIALKYYEDNKEIELKNEMFEKIKNAGTFAEALKICRIEYFNYFMEARKIAVELYN